MAVVKQNCPGWDLCLTCGSVSLLELRQLGWDTWSWECCQPVCPHWGCGSVSVLLRKHTGQKLAEEFWTGSARGRAAGCVSLQDTAVLVLSAKLFCILTHRPWCPQWCYGTWWEPSSCCSVLGAEGVVIATFPRSAHRGTLTLVLCCLSQEWRDACTAGSSRTPAQPCGDRPEGDSL